MNRFDDDDRGFIKRVKEGKVVAPGTVEPANRSRDSRRDRGSDWVAVDASVLRGTDKAVRLQFEHNGHTRRLFFPRSQIEHGADLRRGDADIYNIKRWIFDKKTAQDPELDDLPYEGQETEGSPFKRSPLPPAPSHKAATRAAAGVPLRPAPVPPPKTLAEEELDRALAELDRITPTPYPEGYDDDSDEVPF